MPEDVAAQAPALTIAMLLLWDGIFASSANMLAAVPVAAPVAAPVPAHAVVPAAAPTAAPATAHACCPYP